jgi:hypothetical protein
MQNSITKLVLPLKCDLASNALFCGYLFHDINVNNTSVRATLILLDGWPGRVELCARKHCRLGWGKKHTATHPHITIYQLILFLTPPPRSRFLIPSPSP